MSSNRHASIAAVILAGGRGTRLGGVDKGLVQRDGRGLVEHVAERLRPQVLELVVNANRNAERYAALLGLPVVADAWPDFRGPLAGICAGFDATRADWLLAVPVDAPGLPADLVAQLRAGIGDRQAAYARIGEDALYPLCLLHRDLHADLRSRVDGGEYAVRRWLARHHAVAVPIAGWLDAAVNLNTPDQLRAGSGRDR